MGSAQSFGSSVGNFQHRVDTQFKFNRSLAMWFVSGFLSLILLFFVWKQYQKQRDDAELSGGDPPSAALFLIFAVVAVLASAAIGWIIGWFSEASLAALAQQATRQCAVMHRDEYACLQNPNCSDRKKAKTVMTACQMRQQAEARLHQRTRSALRGGRYNRGPDLFSLFGGW